MLKHPDSRRPPEATAEWRAKPTVLVAGLLVFLTLTGLVIYLFPFGLFPQTNVLAHTILGVLGIPPILWYIWTHWRKRGGGNLSHYQLLGYTGATLVMACVVSGVVVTWQGIFGERMTAGWELAHLATGIAVPLLIGVHLATILGRPVPDGDSRRRVRSAQRHFWIGTAVLAAALGVVTIAWSWSQQSAGVRAAFPEDYNWHFGADRPFAPSLARVDYDGWRQSLIDDIASVLEPADRPDYRTALTRIQRDVGYEHFAGAATGLFAQHRQALAEITTLSDSARSRIDTLIEDAARWISANGAVDSGILSGSERCGSCHSQVYEEWLPSAHRYSAMDDLFQVVQTEMVGDLSPEHTRYCAGCHDPISLFGGAKNAGNVTLSSKGADEGVSCVACHSIVEADVQGNGDYAIRPPRQYLYESADGPLARLTGDFLIRTYPDHHVSSYSRPLYKKAEYCGACHKQYVDIDVNTDIGRVQGQNQYDSWAQSRWHVEDDPEETVTCRECHMPLADSTDPAAGDSHDDYRRTDDGRHRSHRFLGGNQFVPLLHDLEGAAEHVALTEQWLRGEIEIPEIDHKWTTGPVVRLAIEAPERIRRGETTRFQVVMTNNKTGHDFPTGPLDMIESWLEVSVTDDLGRLLYHTGGLDERGAVQDPVVWFKADAFDREGEPIDRHNLWDLVGKGYSRSVYPGVTDRVDIPLECPSVSLRRAAMNRNGGQIADTDADNRPRRTEGFVIEIPQGSEQGTAESLHIEAVLWYRKSNPDFLDTMYGADARVRAPITEMNRVSADVRISGDA